MPDSLLQREQIPVWQPRPLKLAYNVKVGSEAALQSAVNKLNQVRQEIAKVIVGQQDVVDGVLICLLSSGHVLLEGVPGLGKTTFGSPLERDTHPTHRPFDLGDVLLA